jgi:hypothetical protein
MPQEEITISTPTPSDDPEPSYRPLYVDPSQCPCGAQGEPGGLCRKCEARAAWRRHHSSATRHAKAFRNPQSRSRRPSTRPADRRPGR